MNTASIMKDNVEQELRWEPSVHAEKIGVSVNKGVVELDGHVGSFYEKWAAEQAALRVMNVSSVASEIIVDLPFDGKRTDEDIASAASNHFTWNLLVPNTIKVQVDKGYVTLLGTAEWHYQREEAERVVRSLRGVTAVSNQIELKPKISSSGVKTKIEDAFKRDARIEAKNITVDTTSNTVTLRGHVHSWKERDDAEHAAFGAPGVSYVTNLLTVSH